MKEGVAEWPKYILRPRPFFRHLWADDLNLARADYLSAARLAEQPTAAKSAQPTQQQQSGPKFERFSGSSSDVFLSCVTSFVEISGFVIYWFDLVDGFAVGGTSE